MKLAGQISLLVFITVVVITALVTRILSGSFVKEQENYLTDLQTALLQYHAKILDSELEKLHGECQSFIHLGRIEVQHLISRNRNIINAAVWHSGNIVLQTAGPASSPPTEGKTNWALFPSANPAQSVMWIGRYGDYRVVLELNRDWFVEALKTSRGIVTELRSKEGQVIFATDSGHLKSAPKTTSESLNALPGIYVTRPFVDGEGSRYLGTFTSLPVEPSIFIIARTHYGSIQAALQKAYFKAVTVIIPLSLLLLLLAATLSRRIVKPIRELTQQMTNIARTDLSSFRRRKRRRPEPRRRDEVGIMTSAFGIMIEKLIDSQTQLLRKEKLAAFGQFAAAITHEVKNPLGTILGNIQLAKRKLKINVVNEALESLEIAEAEDLRATEKINRLLKFSRLDEKPSTPVNLATVAEKALKAFDAVFVHKHITLTKEFLGNKFEILANEDELHEVLINIFQNAVDAIENQSRKEIHLSLKKDKDYFVIEIQDSGSGIPPEVQERMFQPFFTTKPIGKGTGLGLTISNSIVGNHGGTIQVKSSSESGTTFTITLPSASEFKKAS